MSWQQHDEFVDLAQSRHVVVFKNRDTGEQHHLMNFFSLTKCPTCGNVQPGTPADFDKAKADTLAALNAHHRQSLAYREQHKNVRLGTAPKP